MSFAILFRTYEPTERLGGRGPTTRTYATMNPSPRFTGIPWVVGHHLIGEDGKGRMFAIDLDDAHLFSARRTAAAALAEIVGKVWEGKTRWITDPEIVEVRVCDDCGFRTTACINHCPDKRCRGCVG